MATRTAAKIEPRSGQRRSVSVRGSTGTDIGLTANESARIVRAIRPTFADIVAKFDVNKYPADVYERVRAAFSNPGQVSGDVLRDALLWKYGHLRKSGRIPQTHRRLIRDLQGKWSSLVQDLPLSPDLAFRLLKTRFGGSTRFITVAFIVHLLHQDQIPIIDQHNFRAVNALIRGVRPSWSGKKRPSQFEDILLVAAFVASIIAGWRQQDAATCPTPRSIDQFLMVYGKKLKTRHNKHLQPSAAGVIMSRRG